MIYEADFVLHTRIIFDYRDINMALTSFENSVYWFRGNSAPFTHRSTHMNPFQLRFEMLMQARQMLESEYHAKKSHDEAVTWPTLNQVVERAKALNDFVSEK